MKQQRTRSSASPTVRTTSARHRLGIVPHKHTGHLTHRSTTSYPTLVMIVLCIGVLLASWTRWATADTIVRSGDYTVHASVPGPAPTQPATIESPTNNASFSALPITVSGSCPVNTYETLYRNGAFSGVALCDVAGHYELQTGLFVGNNQLQVRDFSPTDAAGPMSNIVDVSYHPPQPPVVPSGGTSSSSGSSATPSSPSNPAVAAQPSPTEPLIFKTTYNFEGHYTGDTSSWQLDIEGGTAPYAVDVDWGDGNHSLISRPKAGNFTADHIYHKAGGYRGSYVTKFTASDADNTQAFLQLVAIVNNPPDGTSRGHSPLQLNPLLSGGTDSSSNNQSGTKNLNSNTPGYVKVAMRYALPGYGVLVLMLGSFWLGEQREAIALRPHFRKLRH